MNKEQEVRAMAREICIATHSNGKCDCTDTLKRICEGSTLADCETLYESGYRKCDIIEQRTAKSIAEWIAFRAFHGGYAEPVQNILSELSDLIKRNYGVEAEKARWSTECVKRLREYAIRDKEHTDNINAAVKVFANVIMGRLQEVCPMDASCKITLFDAIGIVLDALKEYKK